jgi:hypothetical protein
MMFLSFLGRSPHVPFNRRASRTTDIYGESRNQYLFQESLTAGTGLTATVCHSTGSASCHRFCTGSLSAASD